MIFTRVTVIKVICLWFQKWVLSKIWHFIFNTSSHDLIVEYTFFYPRIPGLARHIGQNTPSYTSESNNPKFTSLLGCRSDDILSYYIFFLSIELYQFLKRLFDFDLYAEKIHCSIFIREVLKLPEVVGIDFVNHTGIYNTLICAICICENLKTLNYLE